jgi:hypothetical protein
VFAIGILFHNHFVAYGVGVWGACCVLPFVVLAYDFLFLRFDELPVGFESDILDCITIEHQLGRRGFGSCMNSGSHCKANC